MASSLLQLDRVGKLFGRIAALKSVSLRLERGRIYGLAGENGAGKSTLVRILSGVYAGAYSGAIELDGRPFAPTTPEEAETAGLSVFHQEIPICPHLSVTANVFLGPQLAAGGWFPAWKELDARCHALFRSLLDLDIDPRRLMGDCSAAERQMALLVRALSREARLIILDEPTTALAPLEVQRLFAVLRRLRDQGITFLFVSHLLPELIELTDAIHVLRDGELVGQLRRGEFDASQLAALIAGRSLDSGPAPRNVPRSVPRLEVRSLGLRHRFQGISFQLMPGEVLGIAGLQGSGRSDLGRALFGAPPADTGEVWVDGTPVDLRGPGSAIAAGIGFVPEDRGTLGLFDDLDVQRNLGISRLRTLATAGWLSRSRLRGLTVRMQRWLQIKMSHPDAPITSLSGGNQQKVLIARWMAIEPRVLVMSEPTRGVDIGAKQEIGDLILRQSEEGTSFVLCSSDLDELLRLADRILVLHAGRVTAEFNRSGVTRADLIQACSTAAQVVMTR